MEGFDSAAAGAAEQTQPGLAQLPTESQSTALNRAKGRSPLLHRQVLWLPALGGCGLDPCDAPTRAGTSDEQNTAQGCVARGGAPALAEGNWEGTEGPSSSSQELTPTSGGS